MFNNFIEVEIAIGKNKGKLFFLPKLMITPTYTDYPIEIARVQFPVRSAFAMTINKAQGATLSKIGVYYLD